MGDYKYPKISKKIEDFIYEEEGNISRDKALFIGSLLVILSAMLPTKVFAYHSSHASHSSHTSSSYGGGHASHESHASHSSHTSSGASHHSSVSAAHSSAHSHVTEHASSEVKTVKHSSVTQSSKDLITGVPQTPDATPIIK